MTNSNTTVAAPLLIDIHCHQSIPQAGLAIRSLDTHEWQLDGQVSGVGTEANQTVEASPKPDYLSLGLHPWFIDQQDVTAALALIELQASNPRLLAIGECGLDKCIPTPLTRQIEVFNQHLDLAARWHKPVMIHCVRAFNELLRIKKLGPHQLPWIVHGFNRNLDMARQLLEQSCYLSLGKALLNPSSSTCQILPQLPLDRLFLETDAATDITIDQIYAAAARILAVDVDTLSAQLHRNFTRVFIDD
jgi:TatD DNase family protein